MRVRWLGFLVSILLVALVLGAGGASGQTPIDCDDAGSLPAAIDAAAPGSRIDFTGTCVENIVFASDDVLDIIGTGTAVIDGSGAAESTVAVPSGAFVGFVNVTITGGSGLFGGGIDSSGWLQVTDSIIEFNEAAASGGGIYSNGTLTVFDSVVRNNTASSGGGIVNRQEGTLSGAEIYDNVGRDGGGVANRGALAELFVSASSIHDNEATFSRGGGFYNNDGAAANITTTDIFDNDTLGGSGGGIYNADPTGNLFIGNSVISGNGAGGGGGIYNDGGILLVSHTTVRDHDSSAGGAISNTLDGSVTVTAGELINNTGGTGGGAVFSDAGSVNFFDSTLAGNETGSPAPGGAILNTGTSSLLINNTTVSGNSADSGGGIFTDSTGSVTISAATIVGNTATGGATGGGLDNSGGSVLMATSIVANNTSPTGPDCAGTVNSGGYNLIEDVSGCTITPATNNLTAVDPMLGPLADNGGVTQTHALLEGSPAVDHIPAGVCADVADQRGIVRPRGDGCDIGAYELDNVPDVVLLVEPNGRWHIRQEGSPDRTFWYGAPGDIPLFGDWNGDGIDTPGMWRQGPGGGFAYLTDTLPDDGEVAVAEFDFFFGNPGDAVFAGDWNGDGIDTLGINRSGHIFLSDSNGSGGQPVPTDYDFWFGNPGDRAFGGDPDGDGRDSLFQYRASTGLVYYTNDTPVGPGAVAATADTFFFGDPADSFVSGDWDGDQDDTAAIFRNSNTTLYLSNTNASGGAPAPTDDSYVWGTAGWTPVAGVWE